MSIRLTFDYERPAKRGGGALFEAGRACLWIACVLFIIPLIYGIYIMAIVCLILTVLGIYQIVHPINWDKLLGFHSHMRGSLDAFVVRNAVLSGILLPMAIYHSAWQRRRRRAKSDLVTVKTAVNK